MGNERSLKVAVLECEQRQEHLAPAVYACTSGYLQLLQQAFTHVYVHASSILHPHINVPPQLSFTGFDVKAEEYPTNVGDFDGVLIMGSLSGVYDGKPWIQRLLHVRP